MDIRKLSPAELQQLTDSIALYKKEVRDTVEQGDLYRLESPYDSPRAALDYVSADRLHAALFVYQLKDGESTPVKPRGLDPEKLYLVREINAGPVKSPLADNGRTIDGAKLMQDGIVPSCQKEFESVVIELTGEAAKVAAGQ
jgi:alpha-galactosidase